eukprot:TRINITY_DN4375_c0_g2_i1.p1 TRINITY_DN4375_c0_g2~~TRINITY_DN4375_c0_g2_i1.p1  ORF type:complete len:545 (-),score=28.75 TRINITY_DN4375_c0_g2_i1:229-1827(-)
MPRFSRFCLYIFTCSQCCRREEEQNFTSFASPFGGWKPKVPQPWLPSRDSGEQDPSDEHDPSLVFQCSRYLRAYNKSDSGKWVTRCFHNTPPKHVKRNDRTAWCQDLYYCIERSGCRSCYYDKSKQTCADAEENEKSRAQSISCGEEWNASVFGRSVSEQLPHDYDEKYGYDMFKETIVKQAYPLQVGLGFADRMMNNNFSIGWFANSYLGMFFLSLVTASADGFWEPDLSSFPNNTERILGRHKKHTLLTRGDLKIDARAYSPQLQVGKNKERIIDKEWMSASVNMFTRYPYESMLSFLGLTDGGVNGRQLLNDKNRLRSIASTILDGYIERTNREAEREQKLDKIMQLFSTSRNEQAGVLLEPVLLIIAINPHSALSEHVCLTGNFGRVHEDDKRIEVDSDGNVKQDRVHDVATSEEWKTPDYNNGLKDTLRRYNGERFFAPEDIDRNYPQLRVSPITPSYSSHALAVPFYRTEEQRKAWIDLREQLEALLPDECLAPTPAPLMDWLALPKIDWSYWSSYFSWLWQRESS